MVKTKVKKSNNHTSKDDTTSNSQISGEQNQSNVTSNSTMLSIIMVLLVVVIVLLIVSILNGGFGSTNSSQINEINEKVTRIDTFFANNFPDYESGANPGSSGETQQGPANIIDEVPQINGRPTLGSTDSSIQIIEYSDFTCGFCGRFHSTTLPSLKSNYVDEGIASFTYKDFPVVNGANAAAASKCVYRELGTETYFNYHDTLFENQQSINPTNLKQWALDIGMDESVYDECIQNSTIQQQIQEDFQEGQGIGVTGTPSVALNDKLIVGACPISTYDEAISLELEGVDFYVQECSVITY